MMRGGMITCLLLNACLCGGLSAADLDELWRVGSLWQVGDNRDRVDEARQAIIKAGTPGLEYALGKLDTSSTLEVRCLTAVVKGFASEAVDPLISHVGHESALARRNVAELLAMLDNRRAAAPLLAQAEVESSEGVKIAQLAALAKWRVADAETLLVDSSRSQSPRVRHRAAGLLREYETPAAARRLIEMLEDEAYYVRGAAANGLREAAPAVRAMCLNRLQEQLSAPEGEKNLELTRRLLPIVATLANERTPEALTKALASSDAAVRAEAAAALHTWKQGAGALSSLNVSAKLRAALNAESDPFARAEIQRILTQQE